MALQFFKRLFAALIHLVVERAVVAENVEVGAGARIGEPGGGFVVLGPGAKIAAGATVAAGQSVEPDAFVEAGSESNEQ